MEKKESTVQDEVLRMTNADFDKAAKAFGEAAKKEGTAVIKIRPEEGKSQVESVIINGYRWNIERGQRVEVPLAVKRVLEEADII